MTPLPPGRRVPWKWLNYTGSAKVRRSVQAALIAPDALPACAEDYRITLEPLDGLEPEILDGI